MSKPCKSVRQPLHAPLLHPSLEVPQPSLELSAPPGPAPQPPTRKQFGFHTLDLSMNFANEILSRGLVKVLDEDDVDDMLSSDEPCATRDELWRAWNTRRNQGQPSLMRSVLDCWSGLFIGSALIHVFDIGLQFVAPCMVKVLVDYNNVEEKSLLIGLLYVLIFFLAPSLQAVAAAHFNIHSRRLGFRIHGATACLVFEKIMRLSQPANASYGPGKLTNIMSTDTFRLQMAPFYANFLWSMPLMLIAGTTLLYKNLGVAGFTPVIVTVLFYPLNGILTKKLMSMNRDVNLDRDARIKLLTEVLHALELVKQLGWEYQIKGLVDEKRVKELKTIASMKLLGVVNYMVWQGVPALLPLTTVGAFVLLGGSLHPGTIFSSLALLDLVNVPMKAFPEALQWLVQARVGVERIEQLLMAEEMEEVEAEAVTLLNNDLARLQNSPVYVRLAPERTGTSLLTNIPTLPIHMRDADFRWASETVKGEPLSSSSAGIWQRCIRQCMISRCNRDDAAFLEANGNEDEMPLAAKLPATLSVPSLKIPHGSLVLVCGPVGSGKSTLVQGLLNEVPLITGQVQMLGSAAYCAQKPWILHGTVRDNILFGEPYDPSRFASVVRACALEMDFLQFPAGEATIIGVRGINLSGGQKARISLARTTYAAASLNILDDPLSAVDPHVAVHLMEQCIASSRGLMRGTTRVLVTHQLQFMYQADLIVVVSHGRMVAARPPTDFTHAELEEFGLEISPKRATGRDEVDQELSSPSDSSRSNAAGPPPFDVGQMRDSTPAVPRQPLTGNRQGVVVDAKEKLQGHQAPQSGNMQDGQEEDRQTGEVSTKIWCAYARAMGPLTAAALVILYIASNGMQMASIFWLARWSDSTDGSEESSLFSLSVYAAFSFSTVVLMCVRMLIFCRTSLRVSAELHEQALWAVLRSPKWWLDRTPTGRILNRFSQDMQRLDLELQGMSSMFAESILKMIVSVIVVVALVPILLVIMPLLVYLYNRVQTTFRKSSRELRRLSSLSKSPIFQNLDEVIVGVSTIRAFRKVADFVNKNAELCSRNIAIDFANSGIGRWMGMRLRVVGMAFVAAVALFLVLQSHIGIFGRSGVGLSAAVAGLALRYALDLTANMESMIQTMTMTEQGLIALERLTAIAQLDSESSLTMPEDADKHAWPTSGEVVFDSVTMRYHEGLPIVLKHLSFVIPGGTSVGVVGRTGSGKTSILAALFRLCKLDSGQIRIDGKDILTLGLHTLRRKLAIIPQEAVGFTGSLRFNLDPFGERSDDEIWVELENVQMKSFAQEHGLDYHLSGGGENLSAGQRQLLCAARAFLQNCRILVLDEATASVDFCTDALIQAALHRQVTTKRMTTITVAHRINTILNSDNVLVMDSGAMVEFGQTEKLANDPDSLFHTFVRSAASAVKNK